MQVSRVEKKLRLNIHDSVKSQLLNEIFLVRKDYLIESDMDILVYLCLTGPVSLSTFCSKAAIYLNKTVEDKDLATKSQNIRNRINKLVKRGLIIKSSNTRKKIAINPELSINTSKRLLVEYKYLTIES